MQVLENIAKLLDTLGIITTMGLIGLGCVIVSFLALMALIGISIRFDRWKIKHNIDW